MTEYAHIPGPSQPPHEPRLAPEDERLLDALAEHGFDPSALSLPDPAVNRRARAIGGLFDLMRDYPVEDGDETLIHATMARIDQYEDERASRLKFDATHDAVNGESRGRRLALPSFISVAAVLLIGVSVMWPMMSNMRNQALDMQCANNLKQLGYAFNQYAADFDNALPIATARLGSFATQEVGEAPATLNLKPLVDGGFCEAGHLNCPGHHHAMGTHAGPSYSFRVFVGRANHAWNASRASVLMGDRNPVVDAAREGVVVSPMSISINHAGRGQNVLSSDGATLWLEVPVISRGGMNADTQHRGDNIWLPDGEQDLRRNIIPRDDLDVLLMH